MTNSIYVGRSEIAGQGVFAVRRFHPGEKVMELRGPLRSFNSKSREDAWVYPDWVGVGEQLWLDPVVPGKFLNHSCQPNVALRGFRAIREDDQDIGCYDAIAISDIFKDCEITMDYSLTEADPFWEMECYCGAALCRQVVGPIQTLPSRVLDAYRTHIADYFMKFIHPTS